MIRRSAPPKPSLGTTTPPMLRIQVLHADQRATNGQGCVGPTVGMPEDCRGSVWPDHIRASHGMGMKSSTTRDNLASLCFTHHRQKTDNGRKWRPALLAYVERRDAA